MKLFALKNIGWLILGICIGCKNSPVPAPPFVALIYYKSRSGADLLNPATSGYFDKDGIRVLDVFINAKGVQVTNPSHFNDYQPSPGNSYVVQPDSTGFYSVQFLVSPSNELKEEFIQLNSSVTDTLTYEIISATPAIGYTVKKVSHKGKVVWSMGFGKPYIPAVFTIVK